MKKGKTNKLGRRILSIVLTAALVVGLMPGNVMTVRAEESSSTELSVTAFATPEQLMSSDNFALHTDTGSGTAQKVYFGMNGESQQTWYIAGSDADNSIVLLCDPMLPMTTGCFDDKSDLVDTDYKTYDNNWNCTYGTAPSRVYANHYGASDLRLITLPSLESSAFSTSEQDMMLATKVYTDDGMLRDEYNSEYTYYTTDKLYAAYGVYEEAIITVGENSADSLNSGLKVSLTSGPYTNDEATKFYLRTPYLEQNRSVHYVSPGGDKVGCVSVQMNTAQYAVVPAFRLNLTSVLFASAATAATSDASLTGTMTFRVKDTEKIKSKAAYATCGVTVNYDEGDGNVFLYVQDADSVYSVKITEDTIVALSDMTGINNLTDENTKIWLEKSEDNVAYAVMAEALLTEHIPNADDGDCTTAITCSSCGTVTTEAKENHIDDNGDGICDHCDSYAEPKQEDEYYQIANANNLMWFAQQVNEGQTAINAKLTADIDMKDIDWTMMSSFAGTFDGNGYTISGLNGHIDMWAQVQCHGFIRTLNNGGFVKNLTFTGAKVFNHEGSGAISAIIVYTNQGTVENCVVKDSNIHHGDYDTIGAVVGANRGTIRNCASISNTMVRRFTSAKAICGFVWTNSGSIENCFNYDCTYQNGSNRYAFTQSNTGTITNCYYYESSETISDTVVTAKTADQFASGEVAYLLNGGKTDGTQSWYQTLKTDTYPVPDNTHGTVYYGYISCSENAQPEYSNQSDAQETKPDHVEGEEVFFTLDDDKAPTCTEGGVGHTECEKCHKVMQTNVTVEASGHTGGTATCKNKAECSVCHEGYGELDKNNHAGETEVKDAKKATCAADGYTGDTYCKDCGAKIATGTKVAALGAPKKGVVAKSGKATYKVTKSDLKNGTVAYVGPLDKKATKVKIPATVKIDGVTFKVTSIEKNAFKNNKKVKTVTIGKNVTTIGDNAFYKCTALTKISIPSKVKTIGKNAFYGCKKMTSATIGKGVSKIGAKAFYGCSKLKTLKIKTTKLTTKKIGSKAFSKTPKSMKVTVPKKKFKTYKSMLIKKGVNKKASFKKS